MSRHLVRASLLLLLPLATLPLLRAQAAAPNATPPVPDTTPAAPALSLEEAIARALKKNFDLQIQSYSTEIAKEALNVAKASFEPVLTASVGRNLQQAASTIDIRDGTTGVGQRNDGTSGSVGVTQLLSQTNGTVGLSTSVNRSASNSRNFTVNPSFSNSITANVTQPLLRNSGGTIAKATVERSKLGLSIAQLNYQNSVLTVVANTETAYNNLVSAREALHIRQLSLALSQRLFEENQARRTTGVMTDLDVLTAEVGVNNARLAVLQSEQSVRTAEDSLLTLINSENYNERPGAVSFADYKGEAPTFDASYKLARDNSPDYLVAANQIRQSEIDLATARSSKKPTLNLTGSLGYSNNDDSYGDVYGNLPERHGNSWSLGLNYNMPWGMKADNARYRSTLATLGSQKVRLAQLDQSLTVQVRSAIRTVQTNLVTVQISAKATELSERQYEAQKARFDAGLSTSRLVLQAQDDLESARFNELSAKAQLRNALVQLHRLETSSLQRFNIQLNQ